MFLGENVLILFFGENVLILFLGENVLMLFLGENVLSILFLGENVLLGDVNVLFDENSMGVFRPKMTPLSTLSLPDVLKSCRVSWLKD